MPRFIFFFYEFRRHFYHKAQVLHRYTANDATVHP